MLVTIPESIRTNYLQLQAALRGTLIFPWDEEYDEARKVWNGMIDKYPALIARCVCVSDVIETVNFARDHGLPVSVRGGGHNVAGSAIADSGIVIDLSGMANVDVDPLGRVARVEGGALLNDMVRATQPYGLVVPAGVVSETGIGGLTLGGGTGWVSRRYGLTIDNLISAQVVTTEGRLIRASATEHPDLFWGLRGGGGGFGVVTSFEFQLRSLGPDVRIAAVFYHGNDAAAVLRGYREYAASAPDDVTSLVSQGRIPEGHMFPAELHGQRFIFVMACYAGPASEGSDLLQPLRELATPLLDMSGVMPFSELQTFWDEEYPAGTLRYYWRSLYFDTLSDAAIERLIALIDEAPSPLTTLDLGQMGGAISRVRPHETAYPHRDAQYMAFVEANWEDPADDETSIAWARRVVKEMQPFSNGGQAPNFPGLFEDRENLYGDNYRRIQTIRARYDPANLFRTR